MAENETKTQPTSPAETNLTERLSLFFLCAVGSMHKQISQSPNAQNTFCHFGIGLFKEETTQTTEIKKAKGQHALLSSLSIRQGSGFHAIVKTTARML
jgi:hypothetical protein